MRPMSRLHTLALLFGCLLAPPTCSAPEAAETPMTSATEAPVPVAQLREDLDALYAQLKTSHYDLFARRPKAEYDALYEKMYAELDAPLTRHGAQLRFTRFVAFGRVAHARIDLPFERWAAFREAGGKALPLYLRVDGEQLFVLRDLSGAADVTPGDHVLAIDGIPALAWLRQVGALVSADTDYMLYAQMEGLLPLLVWLTLGEIDGVELTIGAEERQTRKAWLPTRTRAELTVVAAAEAQPSITDMQVREAKMVENGVAYLRPGPFYDHRPEASTPWDRSAFRDFIDQAFANFLAAGATDLLIDLRDNPGGDNSFSDLMLAWIADRPFRFSPAFDIRVSGATIASNQARLDSHPADAGGASADLARLYEGREPGTHVNYAIPLVLPRKGRRFEGKVHVLVNRHTYSNAVSVAAIVEDYGFGRVLGEETSDLATTYGAMEHFSLQHTALTIGYPKAQIVRPSGKLEARGVVPSVAIARPVVEDPEDPVLMKALDAIRSNGRESGDGAP